MTMSLRETMLWRKLTYWDMEFTFKKDLTVHVTQSEEGWEFRSEEPVIVGLGQTRKEAEKKFRYAFRSQFYRVHLWDDEDLTQDALDVKQKLLALIKGRENVKPHVDDTMGYIGFGEIPKGCLDCRLSYEDDYYENNKPLLCPWGCGSYKDVTEFTYKRHPDCPIQPWPQSP